MRSLISHRPFLIPSKNKRILNILQIIKEDSEISQHAIAERVGISSAIVNKYLSILSDDGYVITKWISKREQEYFLTGAGNELCQSLTLSYHAELVRHYSEIKNVIIESVKGKLAEIDRIGIFGVADTGEIVNKIIDAFGKKVICAFDNDEDKHGMLFYGLRVFSPEKIPHVDPEAVIIASIGYQEEIYNQLCSRFPDRVDNFVKIIS